MADVMHHEPASETSSLLNDTISDTESLSEDDSTQPEPAERSAQDGSPAAAQAAKAIEAAQDSTPLAQNDAPVAGPSLVRVPVFSDEQTPLLDAGPAPPDYAAATAWRRAAPASANDEGTAEVDEDFQSQSQIFYNVDSAFSPPNYPTGQNAGAAQYYKKRPARRPLLLKCLRVAVIAGLTILLVVIVLIQVDVIWPEKPRERIAELDHMNTDACHFDRYSEYATFSFEDPGNFRFKDTGDYSIETIDEEEFPVAVRSGDVNLYAAPKTQQAAVEVWVSVATTDPWEVARLRFVEGWDSLAMVTPLIRKSNRPDTQSPEQCVHTWVGIFVQTNVTLDLLKISAGFMNVSLGYADPVWHHHRKGQDMRFHNLTVVTDRQGSIDAHYMDAERTCLKTLSGNITGIYTLREELLIESSDGAADITVDPNPDSSPGAPQWFTVRTNWNPIGFFWPIFHPPDIPKNDSGVNVETGWGVWDGLTLISYIKMSRERVSGWI